MSKVRITDRMVDAINNICNDEPKELSIRYEDLNFDEWVTDLNLEWKLSRTRPPSRRPCSDIDWDDPDTYAYMMKVGEFHQGRIGNPTTKEHLEKWVKDVQRLPEDLLFRAIKEYELEE